MTVSDISVASGTASILPLKPARVQRSADGGWRSDTYGDVYFQLGVGIAESRFVFLEKNRLQERFAALWQNAAAAVTPPRFTLCELGLGSGLNVMLVWQMWRDTAAQHPDLPLPLRPHLHIISIEKHPLNTADLAAVHAEWPELAQVSHDFIALYPPLVRGFHTRHSADDHVTLHLLFDDVTQALPQLNATIDAWFLDGFSPAKNPDMWGEALFPLIGTMTAPGGTLSTFSSGGRIRKAIAAAGFSVKKVTGFGIKWSMTVAEMPGEAPLPVPLPRVAVIGAGIAGASVARALADQGCRVTVFDRHASPAAEASGNPVGIVYPKLTVDAAPMGQFYSHAFCYALPVLASLPTNVWQACGVQHLLQDTAAVTRAEKLMANHLYPDDFCALLPAAEALPPRLYHARGGMVQPALFVAALLDHPLITCVYNDAVTRLPVADHDVTVLATANAVTHLLPDIPLTPLRGQIMALAATPASAQMDQVICHDGYVTPAINGLHYAGATFQKEGPDDTSDHRSPPRAEDNMAVLEKLNAALPQLGFTAADIRDARATFRATTPDKLPLIGPAPGHADIFLAAGFGAHGLTTAPLAGAIIASLICGTPLPIPRRLYDYLRPDRFQRRRDKSKQLK